MIIATLIAKLLNLHLEANPQVRELLQKIAGKLIRLNLPLAGITFLITPEGLLAPEEEEPDCQITITAAATSHLLHQDKLQTYRHITFDGQRTIGQQFLTALAQINITNVLYQHNSQVLGIMALVVEKQLTQLINYLQLIRDNSSYSLGKYLQFETELVSDKFTLEKFYRDVDDLRDRVELLTKRFEKQVHH